MLNEKRIKEAEVNIKNYLREGLLRKTNDKTALIVFIKNAKDSLKAAKLLFENNIPLWTIVSSYYSMFYIANAVLLSLKFKVGDKIAHKVTADSLIVMVRHKLKSNLLENYECVQEEALAIAEVKSDELIASYDFERRKRNVIQYQTPFIDIQTKAKTSLKRASEFLFEMEGLL